MTVVAARASCGCTQPDYPRDPVAPGDTASIAVVYNPEGRPGRFRKTISVETTAGKTRLTIEGVVIGSRTSVAGQYPVDKGSLKFRQGAVMFGQIVKPHMKTVYADAYNRTPDSLRVRVVGKPDYVDVNFEPAMVGPGEQITMICFLRTAGTDNWGLVEDSIRLSTGREEFSLPFTAIVKEDFSQLTDDERAKAPVARLSAAAVDYGRIERGSKPEMREVTIENCGKSTLDIRRVYTVDRGVDVAVDRKQLKKGHSAVIKLTVDPSQLTDNMLNARVSVITNDPENPVQTFRVVGEVI